MKSSPATLVYVHASSCVLPLRFQHREGESVVCVGCWSAAGHLEGGGRGSEGGCFRPGESKRQDKDNGNAGTSEWGVGRLVWLL